MPEISVIMAIYKEPLCYLQKAINSILNQTYPSFEFIIINDNPKDTHLNDYILSIKDKRIIYIRNEINLGLARTLNKAIEMAGGDFIARMDADDIAVEIRFEKQIKYLKKNPKIDIVGSNCYFIDSKDRITSRTKSKTRDILPALLFNNGIIHPSTFFRKSFFIKNQYNDLLKVSQDYELWCRSVCKKVQLSILPQPLILLRKFEGQISSKKKEEQHNNRKYAIDILFENLGLHIPEQFENLHYNNDYKNIDTNLLSDWFYLIEKNNNIFPPQDLKQVLSLTYLHIMLYNNQNILINYLRFFRKIHFFSFTHLLRGIKYLLISQHYKNV